VEIIKNWGIGGIFEIIINLDINLIITKGFFLRPYTR
jgi:hypothetical protein